MRFGLRDLGELPPFEVPDLPAARPGAARRRAAGGGHRRGRRWTATAETAEPASPALSEAPVATRGRGGCRPALRPGDPASEAAGRGRHRLAGAAPSGSSRRAASASTACGSSSWGPAPTPRGTGSRSTAARSGGPSPSATSSCTSPRATSPTREDPRGRPGCSTSSPVSTCASTAWGASTTTPRGSCSSPTTATSRTGSRTRGTACRGRTTSSWLARWTSRALARLRRGVLLEDGPARPDEVAAARPAEGGAHLARPDPPRGALPRGQAATARR